MRKCAGYFWKNRKVILSLTVGLLFLLFPWMIGYLKFLIMPIIAAVGKIKSISIGISPAMCLLGAVIGIVVGLVLLKLLKANPRFVLIAAVVVSLLWIFIFEHLIASAMLGCSSAMMLMLIPFIHRLFPSLAESAAP